MNKKYDKIHNAVMGSGVHLRGLSYYIYNSSANMNDINWGESERGHPAISHERFRFIEYEDDIMSNLKPFKRE